MNNHSNPNLPQPALRRRLLERVHASHRHESQFTLVRRDQGWLESAGGVRCKTLHRGAGTTSLLVELPADAGFAPFAGQTDAEAVVLHGRIRLGRDELAAGAALVTTCDAADALVAGRQGATLFLRLADAAEQRPPRCRFDTFAGDASWVDFLPGVQIALLCNGPQGTSALARLAPGSHVNGHVHALDEECLMLAGECFVGDTLLRAGEYQFAPRGTRHGDVMSDVGALLYIHGAIDAEVYR